MHSIERELIDLKIEDVKAYLKLQDERSRLDPDHDRNCESVAKGFFLGRGCNWGVARMLAETISRQGPAVRASIFPTSKKVSVMEHVKQELR